MITNQETQAKRQEILHALDLEIGQIQKENDRPGWTIWAILGALATSIWLLLGVIENPKFNLHAGLFTFLTISVLLNSLMFFNSILRSEGSRDKNIKRFRLTNVLSKRRHLIFLYVLYIAILLYLGFFFTDWILGWTLTTFYVSYGIVFTASFLFFILSFFKIPIESNPNPPRILNIFFLIISIIAIIILIIGFSKSFHENFFRIGMHAVRLGGLLWIISFLISKLGEGTSRPILLESLIEIRRDFVLEKIDLSSASKQFDIALSGLEVSDLLQEEIREILQIYDQISKEFKIAGESLITVKNLFEKEDSRPLDEEGFKVIKIALESAILHLEKISKPFEKFEEKALKHAKLIKRLLIFYPHLEENLTAPKNKLLEIMDSLKKEATTFREQYNIFRKRVLETEKMK